MDFLQTLTSPLQRLRCCKPVLPVLCCLVLLAACASTDENAGTAVDQPNTQKLINRSIDSFFLKIADTAGEELQGVVVLGSLLVDDTSKHVYNKPNLQLHKEGMEQLLILNPETWLDVLIHKPDQRLRVVGMSDKNGELKDGINRRSILKALSDQEKLEVVYAFLKSGYKPLVHSWSLSQLMQGETQTVVLQPQQGQASVFDNLVLSNQQFAVQEKLTYTQNYGRHSYSNTKPDKPEVSRAQLVRNQNALVKTILEKPQQCRMAYWQAKTVLLEMGLDYKNFSPDSPQLQEVNQQFDFLKTQCKDLHHLSSLRLVDEYALYGLKRQWLYRNKVPTAKWPKQMNWSLFRRDWLAEAEALDSQSGKTLWPVFHRNLSQMYQQGMWIKQFEKLSQFKNDLPHLYGRADERDRAAAAFMNASKYKRMARMPLKGDIREQTRASALRWFLLSSDMGYCVADREIGDMYENGVLTDVDYKQALFWYRNGLFKDCRLPQVVADFQQRIIRVIKKAEETKKLSETMELPKQGSSNFVPPSSVPEPQ